MPQRLFLQIMIIASFTVGAFGTYQDNHDMTQFGVSGALISFIALGQTNSKRPPKDQPVDYEVKAD